jgi:hypothetical protein
MKFQKIKVAKTKGIRYNLNRKFFGKEVEFMAPKKLFGNQVEPYCRYCSRANDLGAEQMLCSKYGVVQADYACRRFQYDPLKRTPPKPAVLRGNFSDDDFYIIDD